MCETWNTPREHWRPHWSTESKGESNLRAQKPPHHPKTPGKAERNQRQLKDWTLCLWSFLHQLSEHWFLSYLPPSPPGGQMFLLCAWHVITTLICVVSLFPPDFSLSSSAPPLLSNSLWKPKELVRAWLTLPPDFSSSSLPPLVAVSRVPCDCCWVVFCFVF